MKYLPVSILAGLTAILLTTLSPGVWPVLVFDGALAMLVLASAAGWGFWPARKLLGTGEPPARQFCVALAIGLGILGLSVLAFGCAGWLNRANAIAFLAIGPLTALPAFLRARTKVVRLSDALADGVSIEDCDGVPIGLSPAGAAGQRPVRLAIQSICLAPLAIPLAVMLFAATLPPGTVWAGEANGYDALEYHLQVPREYFEADRIHFLAHNVYAQFPQQMESLYLLLMHLRGDARTAAISCQLLHAMLAVLTLVALCAFSPSGWTRLLVAMMAGSVTLLPYVGALAYVESGMLFFAAVAGGIVFGELRQAGSPTFGAPGADLTNAAEFARIPFAADRAAIAAGLCAGFAAGCKYQAVVMIAIGLAISWLLSMQVGWPLRLRRIGLFGAAALIAFAPWMVRNFAFTSNPVYPFAYAQFDGAAWSAEQSEQWRRGHELKLAESESRLDRGLHELFPGGTAQPGFGNLPGWVAVILLMLRRSRLTALAVTWSVALLLTWGLATHMPARFALPLLIPLIYLVAAGGVQRTIPAPSVTEADPLNALFGQISAAGRQLGQRVLIGATVRIAALIALCAMAASAARLLELLAAETKTWNARVQSQVSLAQMPGTDQFFFETEPLNLVPGVRRIWLIGDAAAFYIRWPAHYTVVFNRDPWLEFAQSASPAEALDWLRRENVSHVVFSWPEIERLRKTYGFSPRVTPDWVQALVDAGLTRRGPAEAPIGTGREVYELR